MAFLNKNLIYIDSMQFMNSSLEKLVKNLSDNDFKYLKKDFQKFCALKTIRCLSL